MLDFTTKANTLKNLRKVIKNAIVLPQISFTVSEYVNDKNNIVKDLEKLGFLEKKLIVRSSSKNEDTDETSNAGKFLSIANVFGIDEVLNAISKVIFEIKDDLENQIFIQPYLENVDLCGVAFTVDPNSGGNYYVLNYDNSGSTDSVTSGSGDNLKVYYHFKESDLKFPSELYNLKEVLVELQEIFKNNFLDVEFAIKDCKIYIFQVRPLVLKIDICDIKRQSEVLFKIKSKVNSIMKRHPDLYGDRTIMGIMPDWNPAEMIGIKPKQLALSLYKEIITDGVWAYQRDNYGYRNLRSFPLMYDFYTIPYIDVRVSFNSFLPKGLSDNLGEKLINYYLDILEKNPNWHDKIEFNIAFTSYTFDIDDRIKKLKDYNFSNEEIDVIKEKLKLVTNNIINNDTGLWKNDVSKINILEEKYLQIVNSDLDISSKIYWLLEYCKRYGTLPFAGLARAGFIAVEFLKSLVTSNVITESEKIVYMNSLQTVTKNISNDFVNLSKFSFLKKYGHLRPGTYDISSKRYDQSDEYFNFENKKSEVNDVVDFKLSIIKYQELEDLLKKHSLNVSVLELFNFIKVAIEGREYAKFVFTKILSDVLELIVGLGKEYGISRNDLAYLDINVLINGYKSERDLKAQVLNSINEGKKQENISKNIVLPPLLTSENDIFAFFMPDGEPNYITQKCCSADVVVLPSEESIENKIVLIESADPGYDWIFSKNISGFITAYGGANSHMAIRSSEFSIPAVIGVGDKLFNKYKKSKKIMIDCLNKKVKCID